MKQNQAYIWIYRSEKSGHTQFSASDPWCTDLQNMLEENNSIEKHEDDLSVKILGNPDLISVQGSFRVHMVLWFCKKRKYYQKSVLMF